MGALEQAADWPVDRVAVGVTDADATLDAFGDVDEPAPWASVTKLTTAYATLMAIEEGIVALDDPAGPEGATVRHLLAHAAGLPFDGRDPVAEPGTRRTYSNAGFEILGEHLEEVTGIAVATFVAENVFEPLGMTSSAITGSPAADGEGSVADLLRFARELLRPTLVSEALLGDATSVVFDGLEGVLPGFGRQDPNDWGLGFEIRDGKDPHWTGARNSPETFGHFGLAGSFLWVDPKIGIACVCLAGRAFDDWAREVWPALSDAVVEEHGRSGAG